MNSSIEYDKRFFNPNKKYFKKTPVLSVYEKKFFHLMREKLGNKFIITPQVNLQSIIETDTWGRNDELFRNIDFGIFDTEMYNPILLIEIDGQQHQNNQYWKKRDQSVKKILDQCDILYCTINNDDLKKDTEKIANEIFEIILKMENIIFY